LSHRRKPAGLDRPVPHVHDLAALVGHGGDQRIRVRLWLCGVDAGGELPLEHDRDILDHQCVGVLPGGRRAPGRAGAPTGGRLRERGKVSARAAMLIAAALCLVAYLAIANTGNLVVVMALYSVLGGLGAGIVYATCINMVGKWYPENRGGRTGFVNGGFAYGAVPFIYLFNYHFG